MGHLRPVIIPKNRYRVMLSQLSNSLDSPGCFCFFAHPHSFTYIFFWIFGATWQPRWCVGRSCFCLPHIFTAYFQGFSTFQCLGLGQITFLRVWGWRSQVSARPLWFASWTLFRTGRVEDKFGDFPSDLYTPSIVVIYVRKLLSIYVRKLLSGAFRCHGGNPSHHPFHERWDFPWNKALFWYPNLWKPLFGWF